MNSKERLTRCYFNKETDRPGVYNRTMYPLHDPTYDRLKAYIGEYTDLKSQWSTRALVSPYPMEYNVERYSEEYDRVDAVLHTPKGDLYSTIYKSLTGKEDIRQSYFIKTPEDAELYLSLTIPEIKGDITSFYAMEKEMGDKGIVEVSLETNPAGIVVEELLGPENFALLSITNRDIVHALCERQFLTLMNTVRYVLDRKLGPFFCMLGEECIVPPMHGLKDFYDFNVRYDKPIADLIHNARGSIHIHCHGSIKKVLKGFLEIGVDVLHPFEAPPMGDISASEAKNVIRGRMCMEGNIQIANMYEHTPEQLREETKQLLHDAYDDHKGLIVCPSASPYFHGRGIECFEQFKAMIDTVLNCN